MLKLMKYEFRKQAFSKAVILVLIGLIELLFFIGVIADRENIIGLAIGILAMFTFGAFFYIAFESIITFSNDLKQKCSYMLFLTPNTSYSIVGAKVLAAAIQVVLAGIAFVALFALDGGVLVAKYDAIADVKRIFLEIMSGSLDIDVSLTQIISLVAVFITSWICTITVAFFSITLSTTFLANKKFKGIISFIIFILLNVAFNYIINLILKMPTDTDKLVTYWILSSLYSLCFTVLTYIGTAWMLDKKVSV